MAAADKNSVLAEARQREFRHEQRVRFTINLVGYTLAGFIGALFLMMAGGPVFDPVLNVFGLSSLWTEKAGVYADCSKKENRHNRFCSGKALQRDQDWKHIRDLSGGKGVPFNLYD